MKLSLKTIRPHLPELSDTWRERLHLKPSTATAAAILPVPGRAARTTPATAVSTPRGRGPFGLFSAKRTGGADGDAGRGPAVPNRVALPLPTLPPIPHVPLIDDGEIAAFLATPVVADQPDPIGRLERMLAFPAAHARVTTILLDIHTDGQAYLRHQSAATGQRRMPEIVQLQAAISRLLEAPGAMDRLGPIARATVARLRPNLPNAQATHATGGALAALSEEQSRELLTRYTDAPDAPLEAFGSGDSATTGHLSVQYLGQDYGPSASGTRQRPPQPATAPPVDPAFAAIQKRVTDAGMAGATDAIALAKQLLAEGISPAKLADAFYAVRTEAQTTYADTSDEQLENHLRVRIHNLDELIKDLFQQPGFDDHELGSDKTIMSILYRKTPSVSPATSSPKMGKPFSRKAVITHLGSADPRPTQLAQRTTGEVSDRTATTTPLKGKAPAIAPIRFDSPKYPGQDVELLAAARSALSEDDSEFYRQCKGLIRSGYFPAQLAEVLHDLHHELESEGNLSADFFRLEKMLIGLSESPDFDTKDLKNPESYKGMSIFFGPSSPAIANGLNAPPPDASRLERAWEKRFPSSNTTLQERLANIVAFGSNVPGAAENEVYWLTFHGAHPNEVIDDLHDIRTQMLDAGLDNFAVDDLITIMTAHPNVELDKFDTDRVDEILNISSLGIARKATDLCERRNSEFDRYMDGLANAGQLGLLDKEIDLLVRHPCLDLSVLNAELTPHILDTLKNLQPDLFSSR